MKTKLPRLTEKQFMAQVVQLARLCGWKVYHTFDSRRSAAGFPDLLLLRGDVLLVAELKVGRGKVTTEQHEWLEAFRAAGVAAGIWRPTDWSLIQKALAR